MIVLIELSGRSRTLKAPSAGVGAAAVVMAIANFVEDGLGVDAFIRVFVGAAFALFAALVVTTLVLAASKPRALALVPLATHRAGSRCDPHSAPGVHRRRRVHLLGMLGLEGFEPVRERTILCPEARSQRVVRLLDVPRSPRHSHVFRLFILSRNNRLQWAASTAMGGTGMPAGSVGPPSPSV